MFIGLGGNAPRTLEAFSKTRELCWLLLDKPRFSALYRTEPQLDRDQPSFWNSVITGEWLGSAHSLLERLLMFELSQGRSRDARRPKGPRILDLDLLLFDNEVFSTPRLTLPHAGLVSRRFVLEPLLELQPEVIDPTTGLAYARCLAEVARQGVDRDGRTW